MGLQDFAVKAKSMGGTGRYVKLSEIGKENGIVGDLVDIVTKGKTDMEGRPVMAKKDPTRQREVDVLQLRIEPVGSDDDGMRRIELNESASSALAKVIPLEGFEEGGVVGLWITEIAKPGSFKQHSYEASYVAP